MRDSSPNSNNIMQLHCIHAECAHNAARASQERTGEVCERRLGCRYKVSVRCKIRVDALSITRERKQVSAGDIKWEEKHAR